MQPTIRRLVTLIVVPMLGMGSPLGAQPRGTPPFLPLSAPVLTIGREDHPDYQFVGISSAHRLPNGDFAIVDRMAAVRIFDATGRLARTLGREGAGPGEFGRVSELLLSGDTLTIFDGRLQRLTRYRASGALLGTQPVRTPAEDLRVNIIGRLVSGHWVVVTPNAPTWNRGQGIYRDTMRVGTLAPSSTGPVTWIGTFRGATFFAYMPSENRDRWGVGWAHFAPQALTRVLRDTVVVGDTETPDLQYFTRGGRLVRRVGIPLDAPADLTRHRAAARDAELALARPESDPVFIRASYDAPRPAPLYRDLVVAPDGQLWVRLFEAEPNGPSRYLVLTPSGAVRARVSLPPGSRVVGVQSPWVLAVLRDADDVETLGVIRWTAP